MKKIISLMLIISIFSITSVFAEEKNRIYISSKDKELYYDNDEFDEDIFLHHLDLLPGQEFEDELYIENESIFPFELYLKVIEKEQNELQNELLDNILMTIYLEDEIIYEGKVKGEDYLENGVDLQDSIYLGNYDKNASKKLRVVTMLDKEYSNTENNELAEIDWEFYAIVDDEIKVINPGTSDDIMNYVIIGVSSIAIIGVLAFIVYKFKLFSKKEK